MGFVGPHKLPGEKVRIIADESIRDAVNAVTGAGRRDWHVAGFVLRRDANVQEWGVFAQARAGDPCPRCGKPLSIARGIEVGHIFKLGTKYSRALSCGFTDEKGETHPDDHGRPTASASGARWPRPSSSTTTPTASSGRSRSRPSRSRSCPSTRPRRRPRSAADALYDALVGAGLEVFYDDRDERPGVKFKDADLIGFPIRVNVGGRGLKDGKVEVVLRRDKSVRQVARWPRRSRPCKTLRAELGRKVAPCAA